MFNKVIVWGFPLYTHSQSYIHDGWYKAFKYLGYDTYWFHDNSYPSVDDFDYKNCLFVTEGFVDNNIPLDKSNIYFVHLAKNPAKYINAGVRLIDQRHLLDIQDSWIYSFKFKDVENKLEKINNYTFYEKNANDLCLVRDLRNNISGYEAFYCYFGTDLTPDQINIDDMHIEREEKIMHFIGTIRDYNINVINKLKIGLEKNGIEFIHSDTWSCPKTDEECKYLIQKSYIAPDVRCDSYLSYGEKTYCCTNHKVTGWVACRIFKNISYGQIGITNSKKTYELFGGDIIYSDNEEELADLAIPKRKDYDMIKRQMTYVKDNHTYVKRVKDLISIL